MDPIDGNPLRTRLDANRVFSVWSIGPDITDDDGREYAMIEKRGWAGDIVWRVRAP